MTGTTRREPVRLRTSAERDTLGAATRYSRVNGLGTPAERPYLDALVDARRDVLHRLVRGIVRGRPDGLPEPILVPPAPAELPDAPAPLKELDADRLGSIGDPPAKAVHGRVLLPFPASEQVLLVQVAARHGYDRYRFTGPILRWSPGATMGSTVTDETTTDAMWSDTMDGTDTDATGTDETPPVNLPEGIERVTHPVDVVPLLERDGAFSDDGQATRIRAELAESVANLALAQLAGSVHARAVGGDGCPRTPTSGNGETVGSVLDVVGANVPAADHATAFERLVTDGHPFHPAGKIRRGMNAAEGLAYAPEFTDRIDLRFVAVDREYALETYAQTTDPNRPVDTHRSSDVAPLTGRLYATFDGLEAALERALPPSRESSEYAVVPVHPLQYHRTIPDRYVRQCADGRVVAIPEYTHPATPQLNLRTVVPYETERTSDTPCPHLKLAIPVQTTNVVRTLSPHAVTNGPQVTDVLRTIDNREPFETLGLLAEPAATCYYPPGGPHTSGEEFDDARHLSGLVRTNPLTHPLVSEGAYPVVASSLVADAPTTDRPLVCDLIEEYGAGVDTTSTADAALAFLERYAAVVVPDQLRLLSTYGVALESHLQNSLIVFDSENARPLATLVRDLGGVRVHRERLDEHDRSFDPYPDSDVDADDEADLYRKLYYALFQNHLAELVATIAHELAIDERACWARIRTQCERAFATIRSDGGVPKSRIRRDERALFEGTTTHKALTAMRLQGKRHEYVTSQVSNPLSTAGRQRIEP